MIFDSAPCSCLQTGLSGIIEAVQPVISAAQMREIDRLTTVEFDTPSLLLMEAAAAASLHALTEKFSTQSAKQESPHTLRSRK